MVQLLRSSTGFCVPVGLIPKMMFPSRAASPSIVAMRTHPVWRGVRTRTVLVGVDPDAPPRAVTLPTSWDDAAAAALAALAPGSRPVALAQAAEAWIGPLARRAASAELGIPLSDRLHTLLLLRRGAPDAAVWLGRAEGK